MNHLLNIAKRIPRDNPEQSALIAQIQAALAQHQAQVNSSNSTPASIVQPLPQLSSQTPPPQVLPAAPAVPLNPLKRKSPGVDPALVPEASSTSAQAQPPVPSGTNPGPQPWPNAGGSRSTLTGGLAAGRVSGTPVLISRGSEDLSMFTSPDWLNLARQTRKNSTSETSMRRTIQDLVSSIDPNVKIDPEVEDLLLDIADEFVDSVANFACKLAKHRGGDVLETKDLQLHLERNHNIRIPGFASDETRMSISQTGGGVPAGAGASAAGRRAGMTMTLRSARMNAVQAAKRDAKLL
ncbi:hypothetical protein EXIGLDRAFT_492891 [Exidia glandulosa HHB12029]|uniref:TBP-associated factor 12 n=1 Tax=Exidia glandulosa HHB12029 TaxID=1314781 RepID=A0A165JM78_EXIGL|nr:hypothetical protein EXIGLDRAFT_492891 [Exidia glandulosa HHB12029]